MRVLLLAEVNSSHTIKWARSLLSSGLEIAVFSFSTPESDYFDGRVVVHSSHGVTRAPGRDSLSIRKMRYLAAIPRIRRMIKLLRPDVLHAHYASSYGLVGALCHFKPFVVSVWGSDIFDFAGKNILTTLATRLVLCRAERVVSTSRIMAAEVGKYTRKACDTVPFGVDTGLFSPRRRRSKAESVITVGTVKSLEECYGIDLLLRAFARARAIVANKRMELLIVGGGSLEGPLRKLCRDLGIDKDTLFAGRIPYDQVPEWYERIDIFVALSRMESFGVSVLEASACGLPVVTSDAGGLPEVVRDGVTGFVVPRDRIEEAAAVIAALSLDDDLRREMGMRGRQFVAENYSWEMSIERQVRIYTELRKSHS
jgi:glycosyltransferase involved in cell wall biosynthesis